ncbi:MAG: aminoacyl-tRNA hydrolase [Candidatus Cloacimonetes bacterium]|nr:aminoacyl-tRNA hydrolase [Candidatus Cloacimonadota bacterium]
MKLVCGLGNPGAEYVATRHNVGWWLLDELREAWNTPPFRRAGIVEVSEGVVADHDVVLMKPLTLMNRSGDAVAPLLQFEGFDVTQDLLVVVDDVALPVGRLRLRPGGSSGGHNGLKSVETALRTRDYARLRIGVGAAPPDMDLADWVLGPFSPEEEAAILDAFPRAVDGVQRWITDGIDAAMQAVNA